LISLSLRPAPVTDAWIEEGPKLSDLAEATAGLTLLEAPTPRTEALAISLRLRAAAEAGQTAALITPDRGLARQVTAALDQWDILPDDSAGSPLHLTPPGRFLRHIAGLFQRALDAEGLLTLLKHPLCHAGHDRNAHALKTQRLEARIRSEGLPYPDREGLVRMMDIKGLSEADRAAGRHWADWLGQNLCARDHTGTRPLSDWVTLHREIAQALVAGEKGDDPAALWAMNAGQQAHSVMETLAEHAESGGAMTASEYGDLVGALLAEGEVRDRDAPHPHIMIWGTLEARVQGADLVILAGLNEGSWPEPPAADPWLNRHLRHAAGLLVPERRIGLSAHDYQQAAAAPEVWLSRAIRSEDAETVAARWLNRLQNLLAGLPAQDGPGCLEAMKARGDTWLAQVAAFEAVDRVVPAHRPSPVPPVAMRPRHLSVTEIQTLIRDPYAIYAKHVLGLRKIGPLVQTPDALLRGTLIHELLERFMADVMVDRACLTAEHFRACAAEALAQHVPWPAARVLLAARFDRLADWFIEEEAARLLEGAPIALERQAKGTLEFPDLGVTLSARADRIDERPGGAVVLYDYKSGKPPSKAEQRAFNKQLLIEAAMVEQGGFNALGPRTVERAIYLGLRSPGDAVPAPLDEEGVTEVLARLKQLLSAWLEPEKGFTARLMMQRDRIGSDYDLLSRYGEWDSTAPARREPVT
jgi:double-strand break repair protein AddB